MSPAAPRRGDLPRSRFWLFIPAALVCAAAALGLRGAFATPDIVPPSAAAAVLASAIVALSARVAAPELDLRASDRFVPVALAGGLLGWIVLVPLGSIWYASGHGGGSTPYADLFTVLRSALTDGARQILTTTAPTPPTAVALATAVTYVWWAALWTAISAARGTSPLAALLPATVLLGLGSAASASAGNPGTTTTAAAFLVAGLCFLGVDRATREQPADMVVSGPRGSRRGTLTSTAPFFVGVTVLALGASVVGPHLPGLARRAPWDPRTYVAPPLKPQDETDPLTQAVAWLKRADPTPLLTLKTNAPQHRLRWQVLDVYDGRHWSSSASYQPAGKTLPTGSALDAPPGPAVSVHESVKLSGLPGPYLPAPGRVRSVAGTSVRDDPRLGMIATGDGHEAGPLGYSVDATVPVFDDADRLRGATPGNGGPLDAF
ncbi:MAG: hypothetical protein HOV83_03010, partial [Catenulispora sp.]|nr:hypothetical protein [Catenulispora sp.]